MKHYIRENEDNSLTYIGRHGAKPKDATHEIAPSLIGRAIKIVDGEVVLDEIVEGERLQQIADQQAADALVEYKSKRAKEYPPIADQMGALYKKFHLDDPTEYDQIASEITAVKAKYPKPE